MSEKINICLGTDSNYCKYTATVMLSILRNATKECDIKFYIFSSNLTETDKAQLSTVKQIIACDINFIFVSDELLQKFAKIRTHKHLNLSIYNRLFIPMLLPSIDKAIYIDSDVVVVQNISELNKIDITGYYFAGVEDPFSKKHSQALGYSGYPYINSGVMLINCKELRESNYVDILLQGIDSITIVGGGDQEVINYCFHKKIKVIPPKWNSILPFNYKRYNIQEPNSPEYIESKTSPTIVHFVGPVKPWMNECTHPYKELFMQYYNSLNQENALKAKKKILSIDKVRTATHDVTMFCLLGRKLFRISKRRHLQAMPPASAVVPTFAVAPATTQTIDQVLSAMKKEIYFQAQVASLHHKTFEADKNKFCGKKVVLLGTGPTLDKYEPIKDAIHIGVNRAFAYKKCMLDLLFIQDYEGGKYYIEDLISYKENNKNLEIFCGITGYLPNDEWFIPESISVRLNAKRYYNYFAPREKVFGEDFAYDILNYPLKCFGSVTFSAMQYILYTNPSEIYIVGCDNSHSGYATSITENSNKLNIDTGLDGWKKMQLFANKFYPEIKIFSVNAVGLKGIFTDIKVGE